MRTRTLKNQIKSISLFLAALIFFQSCATYKTPSTLEQAAQEQKEVKITLTSDETVKYKYIVYEDGQFYGVNDNPGEDVKLPISTEEVAEVWMKEKGLPTWAIVVISAIGGALLLIGIAFLAYTW